MTSVDDLSECNETSLKQMVLWSFPASPYEGQIMANLYDASEYECEEDNLDIVLAGKAWTALTQKYIDACHDDYVLMTSTAVKAFLPAWLSRAVDELGASNVVRSSLIFHLNSAGDPRYDESGWAGGLALLSKEQMHAIRVLIRCTAKVAPVERDKEEAEKALAKLQRWFP